MQGCRDADYKMPAVHSDGIKERLPESALAITTIYKCKS